MFRSMDRPTHPEPMLAPSAHGGAVRAYAPGAGSSGDRGAEREPSGHRSRAPLPKLDEHLVKPEVTRDEVVRGERMVAMPSLPEHGDRHFGLDYVLGAHIKKDYVGSTDLITRFAAQSDFATDTCVRRRGTDPKTGERYLEEVAFEVVHTQSKKDIRNRAEDLTARGVRRFFAVFVKKGEVGEWSAKEGSFVMLAPDGEISDRTFAAPLSVRALLDAAETDNGVARALLAKKNPVLEAAQKKHHEEGLEKGIEKGIEQGIEKGIERGILEGKVSAILALLDARGLPVTPALRRTISTCSDATLIDTWLKRVATATSAAEVVGDTPPPAPPGARRRR